MNDALNNLMALVPMLFEPYMPFRAKSLCKIHNFVDTLSQICCERCLMDSSGSSATLSRKPKQIQCTIYILFILKKTAQFETPFKID